MKKILVMKVTVATAGAQSFFFYRPSATACVDFRTIWWGTNGDQPVRGDFDGDGKVDAAVFRSSNLFWYVLQSSTGQPVFQNWGFATDRRVPADYDGDGKSDISVYRPSNGTWYRLNSGNGSFAVIPFGLNGDQPAPSYNIQ